MNVTINENSLRQAIRRQLLQESMEEELFKTVRNKPGLRTVHIKSIKTPE